jgi:hypothetical protein
MKKTQCPTCGHEIDNDAACPGCGHTIRNGAAARPDPTPPPEMANWVITPTPPEELERLRQEFNEEEWLAALREIEQTGGVPIDDVIAEIERNVYGDH